MDKRLLDIVVCPLTKLPLQLLDGERLAQLNTAIRTRGIRNRDRSTGRCGHASGRNNRLGPCGRSRYGHRPKRWDSSR